MKKRQLDMVLEKNLLKKENTIKRNKEAKKINNSKNNIVYSDPQSLRPLSSTFRRVATGLNLFLFRDDDDDDPQSLRP